MKSTSEIFRKVLGKKSSFLSRCPIHGSTVQMPPNSSQAEQPTAQRSFSYMLLVSEIEQLTLECLLFYILSSWQTACKKINIRSLKLWIKSRGSHLKTAYFTFYIKKRSEQIHPPEGYHLQFLLSGKKR